MQLDKFLSLFKETTIHRNGLQFCLGQLLFSLYINDISTDFDSEINLFADDRVCCLEIRNAEDSLKLQKDID